MVALLLPRIVSLVFVALEASVAAWIQANGREFFTRNTDTEGDEPTATH